MSMWQQFCRHPLGKWALFVVALFAFVGIYAPFFASSRPIVLLYDGTWYFPLFRYLFYLGFYTKHLDIFFNLMMFTLPLFILVKGWRLKLLVVCAQCVAFTYLTLYPIKDPSSDAKLNRARFSAIGKEKLEGSYLPSWEFDLQFMTEYRKLNEILRYQQRKEIHENLQGSLPHFTNLPTLWQLDLSNEERNLQVLAEKGESDPIAVANRHYLLERREWLEQESNKITFKIMPLFRPYHWEEDAGGHQSLNKEVKWWDLTRITRKDLVAGLIFGIRISLVVGILAVAIALAIGIPIGAYAGYYGGTFDIIVSRLLEIWESMPVLFMLLLIVAITQSKSIFLVIGVIGLFGWTGFSRYIRGEFFKQRNLPYVEACESQGFNNAYIIFKHVLPNAIPPLLTLLPFAIMGAITSEAALSFLGLGEEGSCSWGVLMDEGRSAFPGESYLLWPPALLLTLLLISIALVGDALRDTLDPKMRS